MNNSMICEKLNRLVVCVDKSDESQLSAHQANQWATRAARGQGDMGDGALVERGGIQVFLV